MSTGSAVSSSSVGGRVCNHGRRVSLYTSWSKTNPSRRFYRCSCWKVDDCGFFEWIDDDLPSRQKDIMNQLIESKKALEKDIEFLKGKCQMREDLITKLEGKVVKYKKLKQKSEKMKTQMFALRLVVIWLALFVSFFVVFIVFIR